GPGVDTTADLTFTGEAAGDYFGFSVGTAGDVNGDGFDDLIVGAYLNDAGGMDAGQAHVFYGGPDADTTADLFFTGEAAGDNFGVSVGTAGDVNRDGFPDLIVGAWGNAAGGVAAGRAYVFYGGLGADTTADLTITGEAPVDRFGRSAGAAGDVNGDGFDDLIVGAYNNDAGGAEAGRAYLYDCSRYHVLSPTGGDTWNVGASESITWLGAEPADIWLSVDGGNSYSLLDMDLGGKPTSAFGLTVPHQPTRFARVKITPHDATVTGSAKSDSLFTIEAVIELRSMRAVPLDEGGVQLSWETDPGPDDLTGYKLERSSRGAATWKVLASLLRDTEYHDASGEAGMRYRLSGINGLGAELILGEIALAPRAALAAWPVPYRGGNLNLSFAIYRRLGDATGQASVTIYDQQGRRVRRIADGTFDAGHQATTWDGRDERGHPVTSGVYFLRAVSAGESNQMRLVVVR
ncbi:MAG: hypothetical protein GY778_01140, partial [bacterium]|nr:hypothetical protein [bacterium]